MQSPLPSSSTLENGMIADPPSPYRTTGIQDSVRSILRGSVLGRLGRNSDGADNEEETIQVFDDVWENPRSPFEDCHLVDGHLTPTETMPINTSKPASFVTANGDNLPANPLPTHALSTRISLLSHSELETNLAALGLLNQQEVRRHGRSNHNQRRRHDRHKHVKSQDTELRILYVVISGLLLTGLLSTYLAIILDHHKVGTIFHVIFILSIMISTILFGHAVVRLVMACTSPPPKKKKKTRKTPPRSKSHLRLHNTDFVICSRPQSSRALPGGIYTMQTLSDAERGYVPVTPIRIHVTGDSTPRATAISNSETAGGGEQSSVPGPDGVLFPPPAYGRWRGSVRADPDLVHWQRVGQGSDGDDGTERNGQGCGEGPPVYPVVSSAV
ncbi:hypothetical protein BDV97DRAFT_355383 [Delphinella strobiligena]|nr:hypothetical protein BDV97DRAFT_355383 [Delphinella strobiligena]